MFSKGSYLVLTKVDLSHPGLSSVSVIKQQCLQVCYTKIINIVPLTSQSCILAPESGPMYRINIPDNLDDPCEYSTIGNLDVDHSQYLLRGFQSSTNKYLWTILQQGPVRQGDNAKAKLVILKDADLESLLKTTTINSELVNHVDFLELLRVSILQCNCLANLHEDFVKLGQSSTKHFFYWLSILLSTIGQR